VLLGVYSNLPWILPPYYTLATVAGAALLHTEVPPGLLAELTDAVAAGSWADFWRHASALAPLARAYALGSTVGAAVFGLVAYRVSLTMILAHRRHQAHHRPQHKDPQ
jgi:uncharacterized protein (DUF2062 family)